MPDKFKNKYRIQSTRLPYWDYGWNASYFVTICTKNRLHYFGEIKNANIILSEIGNIAKEYWISIPEHFPFVILDEFVIMPNHLHGIIIIKKSQKTKFVETQNFTSLQERNQFGPQSKNLASIIRGYKSGVKKYTTINKIIFAWQPRYFDHIIRNQTEFQRIRNYIRYNPLKWQQDRNNQGNLWM